MAIGRTGGTGVGGGVGSCAGLAGLLFIIVLAGCGRSGASVGLDGDCNDGATCMRRAEALLGKNYEHKSVERVGKAMVFFQRGCDFGLAEACAQLAFFLDDGRFATRDPPRVARLHERGCALQDVNACSDLSHLYREGRGVPKDAALASKYRRLACGLADLMTRETFCEWTEIDPVDDGRPTAPRPAANAPGGTGVDLWGPGGGPTLQNIGTIGKASGIPIHVRHHAPGSHPPRP